MFGQAQRANQIPGVTSIVPLVPLCASTFCFSLTFMMYPGALAFAIDAWSLTSSEAGIIQTFFNAAFAISLVATSWLCDRYGARRIFLASGGLAALAAVLAGLFANSFASGLLMFGLLGLASGGTYGPAIILVAQGAAAGRRGTAMGSLLAANSLGYFGSIALANTLAGYFGPQIAFIACGTGACIGFGIAMILIRGGGEAHQGWHSSRPSSDGTAFGRRSLLLTAGYTAHCWELFGMWAWLPAFLTGILADRLGHGLTSGLWIAAAMHLSGFLASATAGRASDHFGRRAVLLTLAVLGAIASFTMGFLETSSTVTVLVVAALYGFLAIGDSAVLSTAMSEAVPPNQLGRIMAVRSLMGFGLGGLAPAAFGAVIDATSEAWRWPLGFALLGVGGLIAALCAALLNRDNPKIAAQVQT